MKTYQNVVFGSLCFSWIPFIVYFKDQKSNYEKNCSWSFGRFDVRVSIAILDFLVLEAFMKMSLKYSGFYDREKSH